MARQIPKGERYQAYMDAIRRRVCAVCLDQRDDGSCSLSGRVCALESHLPRVVETILSIDSPGMDEYVEAIREQICTRCPERDGGGHCTPRERGECALDTYLSIVVGAIEEVAGVARS